MINKIKNPIIRWQRSEFRWDAVKSFALLLCFGSLGMTTTRQWQNQKHNDRYLGVSLLSKSAADYSARRPPVLVAQVSLNIIGDMIRDSQPARADLPIRLASIKALLHSPIPNDTISPSHGRSEPGTRMAITEKSRPPIPETRLAHHRLTTNPLAGPPPGAKTSPSHRNASAQAPDRHNHSGKRDHSDKPQKR